MRLPKMDARREDDSMDLLASASTADVFAAVLAVYYADGSPYGATEAGIMRWTREAMAVPTRRARILRALQARPEAA